MSPRSLIGLFQTGGPSTTRGATYPLWKDIVKDLQPDIKYTGTLVCCGSRSCAVVGTQTGPLSSQPSQWGGCATAPVPPGDASLVAHSPQLAMQIASEARM